MDKKNLPVDVLVCSGAAFISGFLPWMGSRLNGWNTYLWKSIPAALAVLALTSIGVFVLLRAKGKWVAPPQLTLGLAIFGTALPVLIILTAGRFVNIGAIVAAAAGGYLLYLIVAKKRVM